MAMILDTAINQNEQVLNRPNENIDNVTTRSRWVMCPRNLDKKMLNKGDGCRKLICKKHITLVFYGLAFCEVSTLIIINISFFNI